MSEKRAFKEKCVLQLMATFTNFTLTREDAISLLEIDKEEADQYTDVQLIAKAYAVWLDISATAIADQIF